MGINEKDGNTFIRMNLKNDVRERYLNQKHIEALEEETKKKFDSGEYPEEWENYIEILETDKTTEWQGDEKWQEIWYFVQKTFELQAMDFQQDYGFLFQGYTLDQSWWEAVITLRKVAVSLLSTMLIQMPHMQVMMCLLVAMIATVLNQQYHPFQDPIMDMYETAGLVLTTALYFLGLLSMRAEEEGYSTNGMSLLAFLVIVVYLVVTAYTLRYALKQHGAPWQQKEKENQEVNKCEETFLKEEGFEDITDLEEELKWYMKKSEKLADPNVDKINIDEKKIDEKLEKLYEEESWWRRLDKFSEEELENNRYKRVKAEMILLKELMQRYYGLQYLRKESKVEEQPTPLEWLLSCLRCQKANSQETAAIQLDEVGSESPFHEDMLYLMTLVYQKHNM